MLSKVSAADLLYVEKGFNFTKDVDIGHIRSFLIRDKVFVLYAGQYTGT